MAAKPYDSVQWRKLRPRIYERDGGRCQVRVACDGAAVLTDYDVDHIVPWQEGGSWFDEANLRTACWQCNRSRGAQRMKLAARINRTVPTAPSRNW